MVLWARVPCNLRYFTHWLWHQLVIFACLCSYFWGPRGAFLSLLLLHLLEFLCKEKLYFSYCFFLFYLLLLCTCVSISFPCRVSPSIVTSPFCPQIAQNLAGALRYYWFTSCVFRMPSHWGIIQMWEVCLFWFPRPSCRTQAGCALAVSLLWGLER